MIKVTKAFKGVPDGETQCRDYEPGDYQDDMLGPNLIEVAIENEWAEEAEPEKAKTKTRRVGGAKED